MPQSGGHFTRLESERDFSVGVCECAARGAAAAHARAAGPTPRTAPLVTYIREVVTLCSYILLVPQTHMRVVNY